MLEKVVLASGNTGKLKEFPRLFADLNIEVLPQSQFDTPECPGPHHIFVENAFVRALHAVGHSGLPAFADDFGICTAALNGAPDVFSIRYVGANPKSDTANNKRLPDNLADKADKSCCYVCVLVLVRYENDLQPIIAEGTWRGQQQTEAAGIHGFSYDPHFYLPKHSCTTTEPIPGIRSAENHGGQVLRELLGKIEVL